MLSIRNSAVFSRENRFIPVILRAIVITFLMYRVFSLDIFAVSPNDTVSYLSKATSYDLVKNPVSIVQPRGYKYAGYPLFLMAVHYLSGFLPIDPITLMALIQRLLLAVAVTLVFLRLGMISLPLVLYLSSGVFSAQANILYTEGLTVPLAMGFALSLIGASRNLKPRSSRQSAKFWIYIGLVFLSFYWLVLIKINYVVFGLPLAALLLARGAGKTRFTHVGLRTMLPILLLSSVPFLYILAVSIDNYHAHNQFTPVLAKERLIYWGVWSQIFSEHPENRQRRDLAEFYDKGTPYTFLHGVEKKHGGYSQYQHTLPIFKKEADLLIEKSGISLPLERARTFFFAVLGGSKQELGATRDRIMQPNRQTFEPAVWNNNIFFGTEGAKRYFLLFNRGKQPTLVRILPQFPRRGGNNYRFQQAFLAAVAIAGCAVILATKITRSSAMAALGCLSYLLFCAVASLYFADIWRYIVTSWIILAVLVFYELGGRLESLRTQN